MNGKAGQLLVLAGVALWLSGCGGGRGASPQTVQTLQERLESRTLPDYVSSDDQGVHLWKAARRFYQRRGYQPVWITGSRPRRQAAELMAAVEGIAAQGLDPRDYELQALAELRTQNSKNPFKRNSVAPEQAAEADLRLTYVFLKLASHLLAGRVDPEEVDPHWFGQPRKADLASLLDRALDAEGVEATLQGLVPRHEQYALLKQTLKRYRDIAARGGWPTTVPAGIGLKPGNRHPGVAVLRERLAATGDLAGAPAGSEVVDAALVEAVRRFERRHGLTDEGALDTEVMAALNVAVERRVRQVELNLERWRWLPESLGDIFILVNVPTFTLSAVEGGRTALVMRVVAGESDNPTPIFSDQMTTVVFSPYWNIPDTIARQETIPAVLKDPDYLRKNELEIVRGSELVDPGSVDWTDDDPDFRIRQRPGAKNSLGHVKFMFPNKFDVYLHDTPADSLFERARRDFSHGCVRVEKPLELARWVLRGKPEWTPAKIEAAMHSGREQHVALPRPIPVYILYQTVWVEADGLVHFAKDLYGHDVRQLRLLAPSPAQPSPARVARN